MLSSPELNIYKLTQLTPDVLYQAGRDYLQEYPRQYMCRVLRIGSQVTLPLKIKDTLYIYEDIFLKGRCFDCSLFSR